MGRAERVLIAVSLCLACPFSLLVLAVLSGAILSLPERAVAYGAIGAIGAGVLLALLLLKRWVPAFYSMSKALTIPAYLLWSAAVLALFMGLPVGNLMLGMLAGLYVGRQGHHAHTPREAFRRQARNAGLFTATITGLVALAMGLLAIGEQRTMQAALSLVGLEDLAATAARRAVLVAVAVPVLAALQYWLTRAAAFRGAEFGRHEAGGALA